MPAKRQIMRLAAVGLMITSGGIFAVQAGLVPGMSGSAPAQPEAPTEAQAAAPAPIQAALSAPAAATQPSSDMPSTPRLTLTQPPLPQTGTDLSDRMAATPDLPASGADDTAVSPFGLPCGLSVTAQAAPAAMIALDVMDPCQPEARVVIEHSGLNLTERTDTMGLLTVDLPAFESPAFLTVRIGDAHQTALVNLPDFTQYDRVAVQWDDTRDLELHAMEFGADYGEAGHIWHENAGSPARAEAGEGGFVTRLGSDAVDAPMMAQVYTFPRDTLTGTGAVRLSIEAPINARNCGQPTRARTLQTDTDGPVSVTELTFTLPECDAVGDYLVLQNLLQDLRVAAN